MTVFELMERLTGIGANVSAEEDQVAVCFPEERRGEVEALGGEIRRLKPELLRALNHSEGRRLFDGFESHLNGERDEVRGVRAPAKCPPLPSGSSWYVISQKTRPSRSRLSAS
jgi:hypothetical protein